MSKSSTSKSMNLIFQFHYEKISSIFLPLRGDSVLMSETWIDQIFICKKKLINKIN